MQYRDEPESLQISLESTEREIAYAARIDRALKVGTAVPLYKVA